MQKKNKKHSFKENTTEKKIGAQYFEQKLLNVFKYLFNTRK